MHSTTTGDDLLDDEVATADPGAAIAELDDPSLPDDGAEWAPGAAPVQTHGQLHDEES